MSVLATKPALRSLALRPALPVLTVLGVAAVLTLLGLSKGNQPAPHADVRQLPAVLGTWRMDGDETTNPNPLALSASDLSVLALDSYTQRQYTDRRTGRKIQLLMEYRTLGRGAFNHRPEACYPAIGYVLSGRHTVPIWYGGRVQSAMTMTADYQGALGTSHQTLLYWFATGSRAESNFVLQQLEMAWGRFRPERNGWAFVRLITQAAPGDESNALRDEQDFVRQASSALTSAITPPETPSR